MWIRIADEAAAIAEHGTAVEVAGEQLALFRIGGCLYVTGNICTHQFALMTDGFLDGEFIECPMHQGRFHVPTGAAQGTPVTIPLKTYPVRVQGGDIEIEWPNGTS
jgi:naphthalene 1,2-dioxygenase system ferredoxin subunit